MAATEIFGLDHLIVRDRNRVLELTSYMTVGPNDNYAQLYNSSHDFGDLVFPTVPVVINPNN